jgi:hypothetical protein
MGYLIKIPFALEMLRKFPIKINKFYLKGCFMPFLLGLKIKKPANILSDKTLAGCKSTNKILPVIPFSDHCVPGSQRLLR